MSMTAHFGVLKTIELRELLEDEEKINQIIRYSQKFQGLKRATKNMLVSNYRLAKASLSQKPAFRDVKLVLAMKYKELEKLTSIIQVKQAQLAEKYNIRVAQWSLLKKIAHAEEECEMLFQKFVEGKTPVADFLDYFQNSRKLYHVRLVLMKKIQEITEPKQKPQRPIEIHPNTKHFSTPEELHYACHPFCSLTPALVLPAICHPHTCVPVHPPLLLPFGARVNIVQPLWPLPSRFENDELVCPRLYGQVSRRPTRPVRLQKLKLQPRKHHHAPH